MEYCSLNDAFPATDSPPPVGCRGKESSQSAARAEKKKAKRCKGPRMEFVDTNFDEAAMQQRQPDPDRQVEKTDPPAAFKHGAGVEEAYGGMQPVIEPVAPSTQNAATTRVVHNWFGKFVDSAGGITESFTPYTGTVSETASASGGVQENSEEYMLQPAFNKALKEFGGVAKASGPVLPLPNLSDRWKPMTPGGQTAFFDKPAPANAGQETMTDSIEIKKKLDRIFERLDQIEGQRSCTDNSNTEVGMFVISGVFVLFFMDLLVRKTSTSLRVFNM